MGALSVPIPEYWWQAIPAWPSRRLSQSYFALRRVWADHTMSGGRGVYRPRSEDHQTVVLFHAFASLPAPTWLPALTDILGLRTAAPTTARIAYLHEELVPHHRARYHGRNFVIADIVLNWGDIDGGGVISFEVKRQDGPTPTDQDYEKAKTYIEFDSMRDFARRDAAFLVADWYKSSVRARWPHVASWSDIRELQRLSATKVATEHPSLRDLPALIEDLFSCYGVGSRPAVLTPDPVDLFANAAAEKAPPELTSLAVGLAYSASWRRGQSPRLPDAFKWFRDEPSEAQVRISGSQKTPDRRVIRWSANWKPEHERALHFGSATQS